MRFTLRALLAATTLAGLAFFLLVTVPPAIGAAALIFAWAALTSGLLAGVIYGRASIRAFCLGALVPAGATILALTLMLFVWFLAATSETLDWKTTVSRFANLALTMRVWSVGGWLMVLLAGLTSLAVRFTLVSRPHDAPTGEAAAGEASGVARSEGG